MGRWLSRLVLFSARSPVSVLVVSTYPKAVADRHMASGDPRGARHGRGHRATHLYSVDSLGIPTMMQSCASAAKLRDGRPIL